MADIWTTNEGGKTRNGTKGDDLEMRRNSSSSLQGGRLAKNQWRTAALKAKELPDPWKGYHLDTIPEERVTRYMYNPRSGKWKSDEIDVKMQSASFAHGAMRECYRMKKLSKFSAHPDWQSASNYVAKRYMKEAGRQVYFQDVKLQMDAKLWGEEYNKHRPPKKVDFFQNYIIEFKGREGSPLYCVEHLIEGEYIKYNSNSGFVSDVNRLTPHAFSHFTFERSQHKLIIVDIQGVGDLYTDPQMHTVDQKEYGEANLGTKGMALFFSSHICSPICMTLGLTQFDLSNEEIERLQNRKWKLSLAPSTRIHPSASEPLLKRRSGGAARLSSEGGGGERGSETSVRDAFRNLSLSIRNNTRTGSLGYLPPGSPVESPGITMTIQHLKSVSEDPGEVDDAEEEDEEDGEMGDDDVIGDLLISGGESSERYMGPLQPGVSYPSNVQTNRSRRKNEEEERVDGASVKERDSLKILGLIHWELATYHELGRLSQDQVPDMVSVQFHLETAASCTLPSALYTLSHIYLQLPHDSFEEISVPEDSTSHEKGMKYLHGAAEAGHRASMIELARSLDTEDYLDSNTDPSSTNNRERDWREAVRWYSRALETPSGASDVTDTSCQATESAYPNYIIMARLAEMFRGGGHQLEKDPNRAGELYTQAADVAMEMMKGKLANKYYMLAEEAWGEVEEEEEEEEENG